MPRNPEEQFRINNRPEVRRQEKIKNKDVSLPKGVDLNTFYRSIEGKNLTPDQRIACLCFFLYSSGVSLDIISGFLKLTLDTIRTYIDRLQKANSDSHIGTYRILYDELNLPTSNRQIAPLPRMPRRDETPVPTKPTPEGRGVNTKARTSRKVPTRIDHVVWTTPSSDGEKDQ
jgi:hypothetical protein